MEKEADELINQGLNVNFVDMVRPACQLHSFVLSMPYMKKPLWWTSLHC